MTSDSSCTYIGRKNVCIMNKWVGQAGRRANTCTVIDGESSAYFSSVGVAFERDGTGDGLPGIVVAYSCKTFNNSYTSSHINRR